MGISDLRSFEALAVVSVSVVVAVLSIAWSCLVRTWCKDAGTCESVGSCSFKNIVSLTADLQYHAPVSLTAGLQYHAPVAETATLAGLTRGRCGVGERLTRSAITNGEICTLLRPFPNALNDEVMQPNATTDHERACGAWIHGGTALQASLLQNVEYLAFYDSKERADAVRAAEAAQHAGSQMSSTNLGKFRAACNRATLGGSGALRIAGQMAYQYLVNAASIDAVIDETTALQSLGVLVGHYCDAPILFGLGLRVGGLRTLVRRGRIFDEYAMASALQIVGASDALQSQAEAGNAHVNAYLWNSPKATPEQIMTVLRSATERPEIDDARSNAFYLDIDQPEADGYVHLLANGALADAKGYLHGIASLCAFSLENLVTSPGNTLTTAAGAWRDRMQRELPKAASLGALKAPENYEPMFEIGPTDMLDASSITMSQLIAGNDWEKCLEFSRLLFPDEIDRIHFDLVISPTLYDRMETTVAQARAGVAHVLRHDPVLQGALKDPNAIAAMVDTARIRIPGAPRNTWAGSSRSIPVAELDSSEGLLVMAARQARALYLDRQSSLVYESTHPCEAPSAYASLMANVRQHN